MNDSTGSESPRNPSQKPPETGSLLGIYGKSSSAQQNQGFQPSEVDPTTGEIKGEGWSYAAALVERYALQSQARRSMLEAFRRDGSEGKAHGVTRCRRWLRPRGKHQTPYAEINQHRDTSRTFFTGTEICASPWGCPVCSAKIAQRRADEVRAAVDQWIALGGICLFVTMTVPHTFADILQVIVQGFRQALKLFRGGRGASAIYSELGCIGVIRALEITWGLLNGWHLHSHEIWFCRTVAGFPIGAISRRWQDSAVSAGFKRPSSAHGLRVDIVQSTQQAAAALADYLVKIGKEPPDDARPLWGAAEELTRANSKRGHLRRFSPWDFLRAQFDPEISTHDRIRYRERFAEYVHAFKGTAQLFWTRGLKARFQVQDKTDQETAEESREAADVLSRLEVDDWDRLFIRADNRATVLLLGQSGGSYAIQEFIKSLPDKPRPGVKP